MAETKKPDIGGEWLTTEDAAQLSGYMDIVRRLSVSA